MYTIPHRDTVAGEATVKSATSNNIFILWCNFILSPFDKHNTIESSNTEFMFSTQSASTGPSNITHDLLSFSGF